MLLFPELLQEFEPLDYHADDIKDTVLPGEVTYSYAAKVGRTLFG